MTGIDMALCGHQGQGAWACRCGTCWAARCATGSASTPTPIRPRWRSSLKARGVTAIKCGGVSDPVRKVAALREAVGDDMDIMIDLHGPPWMTPGDAARLARALEPYHLMFIEDPIAPDNLDGYKRIRDAAQVPLAAGERIEHHLWFSRPDRARVWSTSIQPDTGPCRRHHPDEENRRAWRRRITSMMAPHSGSLGPVAEYAALHLLAAIPNALFLERIEDDWAGQRARPWCRTRCP